MPNFDNIVGVDGADLEPGDEILVLEMPNDPDPIPAGTKGRVLQTNRLGQGWQIWVEWDIPRTLSLVIPPDKVAVVTKGKS